ncbi:MAG TPA: pyridoxal phosphate-dependent aminotransferase [Candidatus Polarisedimenticolaceae bacterium]|nr:pyridoxal phosphate-dependent aminotransferase [Candidatus Polarisedimenticolaceae bacterium]
MPSPTPLSALDFGPAGGVEASLSDQVLGLVGSEILKIAGDIRQLAAQGERVCNLTVGDFDPRQFPIPEALREGIESALRRGETNYPPSDGLPALREAVADFVAREWGARYPVASVLIACGARPILYSAYRCVINPGDPVLYPVPSWNNNHYTWISGGRGIALPTQAERGFMPTLEQLRPHLREARLLCLNSPLNPTGTVIGERDLRLIVEAVVEENQRRSRQGQRHLFLLHDQVYASLIFGEARHFMPVALVPESAPWVISLDGISKSLAATGLRVGWALAAPELIERMKNLTGHIGCWAPRPEQVGVAGFLRDPAACAAFQREMNERVRVRLEALHAGFTALRRDGYPVDCIAPQGAMYLSLRLDLPGRSNEEIRRLLLERARLAVVPFQAFGLEQDTGWFRLSVGAVALEEIHEVFPRLRGVLDSLA